MRARPSVVIVGAGISGLHAAHLLTQRGHRVRLFEARERVGGRLHSTPDGLDLGASWFWPGESRVARLVAELAIAVHEQYLVGDAMYDDAASAVRLDGNPIDVASVRFTDGAHSLTRALAQRLDSQDLGRLDLGSRVHTIEADVAGVRISVADDAGTKPVDADHVIIAIPPALAASSIHFRPDLPGGVRAVAERTPVWMGAITKVVACYEKPFWREAALSGSAISHRGPMREIHDLSGPGGDPAALFGFAATSAATGRVTEREVVEQLVRLFGPSAATTTDLHLADWRTELHTSPVDVEQLTDYSSFGHRIYQDPMLHDRVHWTSTETAPIAPGHIEGALAAAERAVAHIIEAAATQSRTSREEAGAQP